jgi:hypothetical protein
LRCESLINIKGADKYKSMKNETKKIALIGAIIILIAGTRLMEHPFNFTPVTAISIFAGCYLRKYWGIIFPLAGMLVSDYFIGFYDWKLMAAVYIGIGISFYVGWYLQHKIKWYRIILAALISSIAFFVTSNFAVWFFYQWYPHNLSGLTRCFVMALPFFKNNLVGDLIYTGALFGGYEFARKYFVQKLVLRLN